MMNDELVIPVPLSTIIAGWLARTARRLVGLDFASGGTAKFRWGEVSNSFGLSIELIYWGGPGERDGRDSWSLEIHLGWPNIFITLPLKPLDRPMRDVMLESWGFSFSRGPHVFDSVHLNWGHRVKIVRMPWSWEEVKGTHQVWTNIGWRPYQFAWVGNEKTTPDGRHFWTFPYRYRLRNGTLQERTATMHVERREYRWRALPWLPWPRMRSQWISVDFDQEVGEGTGSWKGGVTGCSEDMLPGEEPRSTLWRMERTRRFER